MNIKELNKKLNTTVQGIILLVLSIIYLFITLYNNLPLVFSIEAAVVSLLILGAVWLLFKDGHYLASYSVLFLLVFGSAPFNFVRWILSFDTTLGYVGKFPFDGLIYTIGAVYLGLMILSLLLDEGFKFNKENFYIDKLMIAFTVLMFLTQTLNGFILVVLVKFMAINYKKESSLLLMASKSLTMPFILINMLTNSNLPNFSLNVYLLTAVSIVVLVFIVMKFLELQKAKKPDEQEPEELEKENS